MINNLSNYIRVNLISLKQSGDFTVAGANRLIFDFIDNHLGRNGESLADLGYDYQVRRLKLFADLRPKFDDIYGEKFPEKRIKDLNQFPDKLETLSFSDKVSVFLKAYGENLGDGLIDFQNLIKFVGLAFIGTLILRISDE